MFKKSFLRRASSFGDLFVLLLIGTIIVAVVQMASEWRLEYRPVTEISLSIWALPRYALFSASRGLLAYLISLVFTLIVGYTAARSRKAERIIIPALDVLQSVPVLGFLPGLVLGLIAIFPRSNLGLELAAIIMIFTGQVWNMTFAFYGSLKSVPNDLMEASSVIGLHWKERLKRVELPYSAVALAWNSLMSMAGGWFFLSVCEAFSLGRQDFRLPGVGAYMAVATARGDVGAMLLAIVTMVAIIVGMDFVIWRPILVYVQRFRLEDRPGDDAQNDSYGEPFIRFLFRKSKILHWLTLLYKKNIAKRLRRANIFSAEIATTSPAPPSRPLSNLASFAIRTYGWYLALGLTSIFFAYGSLRLFGILKLVPLEQWLTLISAGGSSLLRVIVAVVLGSLWTVPVGIWIGRSPRRVRRMQPVIQVLASFPAPMLYPIVLGILFFWRINFEIATVALMLLGVQWYILFNVLAGAHRISHELGDMLLLTRSSRWTRWKTLYLPSVFPALVTGWITAVGGAWNATIVAEYLNYKGTIFHVNGLGAAISVAAAKADFPSLAAGIAIMIFIVILLNRTLWAKLYALTQRRFRLGD